MFHVQTHPARVCRRRAAGLESRVLMKTATREEFLGKNEPADVLHNCQYCPECT